MGTSCCSTAACGTGRRTSTDAERVTLRCSNMRRLERRSASRISAVSSGPSSRHRVPSAPCVLVSGRDVHGHNRLVAGPADVSGYRGMPALTTRVHSLRLPLEQDPDAGWKPYTLFRGGTPNLKTIGCHASVLDPGRQPHPRHRHDEEEILIVLDGEATLVLEDATEGTEHLHTRAARNVRVLPGGVRSHHQEHSGRAGDLRDVQVARRPPGEDRPPRESAGSLRRVIGRSPPGRVLRLFGGHAPRRRNDVSSTPAFPSHDPAARLPDTSPTSMHTTWQSSCWKERWRPSANRSGRTASSSTRPENRTACETWETRPRSIWSSSSTAGTCRIGARTGVGAWARPRVGG